MSEKTRGKLAKVQNRFKVFLNEPFGKSIIDLEAKDRMYETYDGFIQGWGKQDFKVFLLTSDFRLPLPNKLKSTKCKLAVDPQEYSTSSLWVHLSITIKDMFERIE